MAAVTRRVRFSLQEPPPRATLDVKGSPLNTPEDRFDRRPRAGWYYRHGGRVFGPLTLVDLAASCRMGFVSLDDPVCFKQASGWSPCREVLASLADRGGGGPPRPDRTAGFALVDLLLVLGICLAAVVVLVPAVQGLRERSWRDGCAERMRRVAQAVLEVERTAGAFPTGMGFQLQEENCPAGSIGIHLWTYAVLPLLGQAELAGMIDPRTHGGGKRDDYGGYDPDTVLAFQARLPDFECPADTHEPVNRTTDFVWRGYARSNVVGCFSPHGFFVEPEASTACMTRHHINGGQRTVANPTVLNEYPLQTLSGRAVFNLYGVPRTLARVTDGQSTTVMLSEVVSGGSDPDGQDGDMRGTWWEFAGVGYSHFRVPNSPEPDLQGDYTTRSTKPGLPDVVGIPGGWPATMTAARSRHPDGVNVACVDGSVRFVTADVEPAVWRALGSMDGGDDEDRR